MRRFHTWHNGCRFSRRNDLALARHLAGQVTVLRCSSVASRPQYKIPTNRVLKLLLSRGNYINGILAIAHIFAANQRESYTEGAHLNLHSDIPKPLSGGLANE